MIDPFALPPSGSFPWSIAEHSYAGWVPNVSGHLSFNRIPAADTAPAYNHQTGAGVRTVVVHRRRTVQDLPFFDWLVRWFYPSATQDFILVARSCPVRTPHLIDGALREFQDSHGALVGTVTVLPNDEGKRDGERATFIRRVDERISDACDGRSLSSTGPDRTAEDIRDGLAGAPGVSFTVSFALFRSGELRIWFDMVPFLGRETDAKPTDLEQKVAALLPAQVYYFIKDLLHAHYHHDSHQDQALPFDRYDGGTSDGDWRQGEIAWRYASLRGLVRLVIELRQGRSFLGHKRALGIIAYAQAFQRTLARITRPRKACSSHEMNDEIMPYHFDDLKMSIEAANSVAEASNTSRQQLFAIMVLIVLSALSLWAGAAQVAPALCGTLPAGQACSGSVPVWAIEAVSLIIANPPLFVLLLLAIGTVAFLWIFKGTGAVPPVYRFVRWAPKLYLAISVEASRQFRRDRAGYLLVMSLIIAVATALAVGSALLLLGRHPPSVKRAAARPINDTRRWPDVFADVGKSVEDSGILVRGSVAPQLRQLLGEDYPAFVRQFKNTRPIRAEGDHVLASSDPRPGGDGAYLLIDPGSSRIEVGLRRDGNLVVHRTGGRALARPTSLPGFGTRPADGDPVAPEATMCEIKPSASGRSVQLSGSLRATEFCEYSVELKRGQTISFDPRHANGLDVLAVDAGKTQTLRRSFSAGGDGRQVIRVVWLGGARPGGVATPPKPFYVRLEIR